MLSRECGHSWRGLAAGQAQAPLPAKIAASTIHIAAARGETDF
jgi:hypothetical protein